MNEETERQMLRMVDKTGMWKEPEIFLDTQQKRCSASNAEICYLRKKKLNKMLKVKREGKKIGKELVEIKNNSQRITRRYSETNKNNKRVMFRILKKGFSECFLSFQNCLQSLTP